MIRALRQFRPSRLQLVAVTSLSLTATVLIIVNATGSTALDRAVFAALSRRVVIHHAAAPAQPAAAAATSPSNTAGSTGGGGGGSSSRAASASSTASNGNASTPATTTTTTTPPTPAAPVPKLKHVFVIALTTPSYAAAFGKGSVARYLNATLRKRGTLLAGYKTLAGGSELADELALVSGQAPNPDTRSGCQTYAEFPAKAKAAADGAVSGTGCVYPNTALTIGDQVTAAGLQWRAYLDDMGKTPCSHPNSNAADNARLAGAGPEYDTRHNPFIYFHSLLDLGDCASDDLSLDRLPAALSKPAGKAPAFAYVAPGACADAATAACPDGSPPGLASEDTFLKAWVPRIERSAAYRDSGALVIAFSTPAASGHTQRTGALVLSKQVAAGSTVATAYDPYALLRTVEDLFGFTPLAHAKAAKTFADLFIHVS